MKEISSDNFSKDILEFLILLYNHKVKYLIVGGQAVIFYGHARFTGDIDIFYQQTSRNIKNLYNALLEFWHNDIPGIQTESDLMEKNIIFQFGVIPNRIDLISTIAAVDFYEAWKQREIVKLNVNKIIFLNYINLEYLIKNKERLNRERDKEDLKFLKELNKLKKS